MLLSIEEKGANFGELTFSQDIWPTDLQPNDIVSEFCQLGLLLFIPLLILDVMVLGVLVLRPIGRLL
jgi:hypothetical protein